MAEPSNNADRKPAILIVDDDAITRTTVDRVLTKAGYCTCQADCGESAVATVQECTPQLVLLDVMMPGIDGFETCRRLREQWDAQVLPILMMTGLEDAQGVDKAFQEGATDFITKPLHWTLLVQRVRFALRARAMAIELASNVNELRDANARAAEYRVQLERMNAELEDRVERRTQELGATQSQLLKAEKLASVGHLAAGVAHEVNNPLSVVTGNLGTLGEYTSSLLQLIDAYDAAVETSARQQFDALREQLDLDFLCEDLPDLLGQSREELQRVKRTVQDLRSFAQIDQRGFQFVDLNACMDRAVSLMQSQLGERIEIERRYAADLPEVECMVAELSQVFSNLLRNAIQAVAEEGRLCLSSGQEGGEIWFEVQDEGCGIAEDVLPRIFDPFFTTREVGAGAGLGLSVAYGVIEQHNGRIEVESATGSGSRFRVVLPLVRET